MMLTDQIWKLATGLLAILLLVVVGAGSALWWSALSERDKAQEQLAATQRDNAELRGSLRTQNSAIEAMQRATALAEDRGRAAQQIAESAGRRYDSALAKIGGSRAVTCADAMPAVNALLESVR